jgi:hypothetical protein
MSGTVHKDFSELSRQVSEWQTRTLVELVIDVLAALEHRNHSVSSDRQADVVDPVVKTRSTR